MATDTRIDSILFGCALAVWHNPVLDLPTLHQRWWKYFLVPTAIVVLVACLLLRDHVLRETVRYSLQGAALTLIFIAAIRFPKWALFRILNWSPLAFIGVLSYSLYLMHYAVINSVNIVFPSESAIARAIWALVISFTLAWILYKIVERPCARLRRQLID